MKKYNILRRKVDITGVAVVLIFTGVIIAEKLVIILN
jgi:hypothetical protein